MSLEFGTLVLSKKGSLRSKQLSTGYVSYCTVVYLRVGIFLFQRPDTKEMLIEMPEGVIHEKAEDVYLYTPANVEHFKGLITESHQCRVGAVQKRIQDELDAIRKCQEKVATLRSEISVLEAKNLTDYSDNRSKQIRGLSKNLRKHERKLTGVMNTIRTERDQIKRMEKELEMSLSSIYQTIEIPNRRKVASNT